ncbi:unnamed protein product [Rotaria sp. Silwood1]|nr:unnamed protein product [Rotaria sp. Silwood1]CAF0956927.1 unnamed protein product [Rotaria sp. Silwood1]CAF3379324.1 unnamed protein product [Rotaria sp. Silwood1]
MPREIVTLQIGNASNNVGAELWNQLDIEQTNNNTFIDYNTYYTFNKKTNIPSPRVLIIDYRNTFGYLLNEDETNLNLSNKNNDSSIEIVNREIDNSFWSNNLKAKVKFNSKSLIPLTDYWFYSTNNQDNQFDIYSIGQQIYKKMSNQIENSLHYLLESCDSLQSFRCLYDINNSFSGLFTSIQDYLHDECPKNPVWSFGIGDNNKSSLLNLSLSVIQSINENQMPTITCLNELDKYKLSLSIQHSLLSSTLTLDLLADRLCPMKKNFLNLFSHIPLNLNHKTLFNYLELNDVFQLKQPISCHYFIRGIEQKQLYNQQIYNFNISTSSELISSYLREQYGTKMFLSTNSWIEKYDDMSFITGLFNDDEYSLKFFDYLLTNMKKINYKTLSKRWQENDFDEQMFEQLINNLNSLHEQYQLNTI